MKKFMSTKMKIFLLVLFILSVLCYSIAAVNLYNSNYSLSSYFSEISDWHGINNWHFGWSKFNNHLSGDMTKDFPSTVENINIITASSDISLTTHDAPNISMDIHGDFSSNNNYNDCIEKFDVTGKDFNIKTYSGNFFSDVSLNISIPNDFKGNINIQTHSGKICISSLTLSNLSLSTTSGDIDAYNINVNKSNIKSTSGEIKYTGSLGESNVASTSGDVELNLSDLGTNSTINSTSGEVNVNLASTIGYKANISSTSGEINAKNADGHNLDIRKNYSFTNGDGSKNISINTTSGDISIY